VLLWATSLCLLAAEPLALSPGVIVGDGARDDRGVLVHQVTSPLQAGTTKIEVLVPAQGTVSAPGRRLRVLYLLPVEALDGRRWGDAMEEIRKHGLHDKHGLLCVYPTFSHLPWYADHPSDPEIRQERYLLEVVLAFVESRYGGQLEVHAPPQAATPEHAPAEERAVQPTRLLVGFSKSGWGAFSLILRHPDLFQRAAAWDAPLMQEQPNQFGMGPIFGTTENFRLYQISALLAHPDEAFLESPRLIHLGYDNFREHHRRAEQLLNESRVQHIYQDGPQRRHHWNSGWLADAVELLARKPDESAGASR